jgi:hypothetical protein
MMMRRKAAKVPKMLITQTLTTLVFQGLVVWFAMRQIKTDAASSFSLLRGRVCATFFEEASALFFE